MSRPRRSKTMIASATIRVECEFGVPAAIGHRKEAPEQTAVEPIFPRESVARLARQRRQRMPSFASIALPTAGPKRRRKARASRSYLLPCSNGNCHWPSGPAVRSRGIDRQLLAHVAQVQGGERCHAGVSFVGRGRGCEYSGVSYAAACIAAIKAQDSGCVAAARGEHAGEAVENLGPVALRLLRKFQSRLVDQAELASRSTRIE
jgi:hypothetical protein